MNNPITVCGVCLTHEAKPGETVCVYCDARRIEREKAQPKIEAAARDIDIAQQAPVLNLTASSILKIRRALQVAIQETEGTVYLDIIKGAYAELCVTPEQAEERRLLESEVVETYAQIQAHRQALTRLSDRSLVLAVLKLPAADHMLIEELMSRVFPAWEEEKL